jgi:hypothetical protein
MNFLSLENWKQAAQFLMGFARNPVQAMKNCPQWNWATVILVQVVLSVLVGALAGLIAKSWMTFFLNLFVFPISTLLSTAVGSGFFYYTFMFIYQKNTPFRTHYTIVALAYMPFLFLRLLSFLGPTVVLVGFAAMCLLLVVGLVENFDIPRQKVIRLILLLSVLFLIVWVIDVIQESHSRMEIKESVKQQTLDQLQKQVD